MAADKGAVDTMWRWLQLQGTAVSFAAGTAVYYVNATFPRGGSAVPIISNTSNGGNWFAYGR